MDNELQPATVFPLGIFYAKPGFENEFNGQFEKMVGIMYAKKIEMGWDTYTGIIGTALTSHILLNNSDPTDSSLNTEKAST